MVNKKFLLLSIAGMFFILVFSNFVNADWQEKVDWNGNAFDWESVGCYANTGDSEKGCLYSGGALSKLYCGNSATPSGYIAVSTSHGGAYYVNTNPVYAPSAGDTRWWFGGCNNRHDVGKHFENIAHQSLQTPGSTLQSGFAYVTCADVDGDGESITGGVCGTVDCDDGDGTNYPGNTEIADGKDNNCVGGVDEGFSCVNGQTQQCGSDVGACEYGTQTCSSGQWGVCGGTYVGPSTEIPGNNVDENCDGIILNYCTDTDGDKWVTESSGQCDSSNIVGFKGYNDCNDVLPSGLKTYPNAPERCDSVDNQCVNNVGYGKIDENPDSICQTSGDICWAGVCKTPTAYWTSDAQGQNKITASTILNPGDKYYLVLENFPKEAGLLEFEIFEKDINKAKDDDPDEVYAFYFMAKGFKKLGGTFQSDPSPSSRTWSSGTWERTEYGASGSGTFTGLMQMQNSANVDRISGTWAKDIFGGNTWEVQIYQFTSSGTWEKTGEDYRGKSYGTWEIPGGLGQGTWSTTQEEDEVAYSYTSSILGAEELGEPPQPTPELGEEGESCDLNSDCQSGNCVDYICQGPPITTDSCSQYTLCSDYATEKLCGDNSCSLNPQNIDCNDPNIDCGCSWSTTLSSCNAFFINSDPLTGGTCTFQEDTTDDCSDGFLEYSTTATWSGDPATAETNDCVDGTIGPIICSSKTKLPLENKYGIILT
ncbi:MAG: putative metal-binding motif-containing protein, partial [Candidatus Aenigmarchaeota archaeon]|nr:putative metal-binding motif-containing protein [Candidatus Aenigmarchaeota archaeon]